jgi:phosphatidate cytidylyltransferase
MESKIFYQMVIAAAIVYATALILSLITTIIRKKKFDLTRHLTWFFYAAILITLVGLGGIFFTAFLSLVIFQIMRELYGAIKRKDGEKFDPAYQIAVLPLAVATPFILHYKAVLILPHLLASSFLLFCIPVIQRKKALALCKISQSLCCFIIAVMLSFLILIRNRQGGTGLCFFLIILAAVTDIAAYVVGRLFGRWKFIPEISPTKTAEGTVLAAFITLGVALMIRGIVPGLARSEVLLGSLVIALVATVGDLIFSAFKRDAGVKDYGKILPGIGGILDRFDSIVFSAPAFYYFLRVLDILRTPTS